MFFKRNELDYPLGGGFGEGFDGCGMGCGAIIAAEPAGWLQQGLVCAAVMDALGYPSAQIQIRCGFPRQ